MGQEITKLVVNYESNVKQSHANNINGLADALERLSKVDLRDGFSDKITKISKALDGIKGFKVNKNFETSVKSIISTINSLDEVKDITPFAKNLESGFKAIGDATKSFGDGKLNVGVNFGRTVTGLVNSINNISTVKDITPYGQKLKTGFRTIANAVGTFDGMVLNKIGDIGKVTTGLVYAVNGMDEIKDISSIGETLKTSFATIANAISSFDGMVLNKIGDIGNATTSLVETINSMGEVRDISGSSERLSAGFQTIARAISVFDGMVLNRMGNVAKVTTDLVQSINNMSQIRDITSIGVTLRDSFQTIADAVRAFDGMDLTNVRNIGEVVNALNSLGSVKAIDYTVVRNAEVLAKAINTLDKNVTVSNTRLKALANTSREVGKSFETASKGAGRFGKKISILRWAATIYAFQKLVRVVQRTVGAVYGLVDAFGEVQNTMSFFSQSFEAEAPRIASTIQKYADAGIIDFTEFANQASKLNQMYKNYGIAADDAATMSLSMTQLAYDASYALGKNGKDIELWMQRITSMSTGNVRGGYYLGLDLSVKSLSENFDGLSNNVSKAEKWTAAYKATMEQTVAIQGQMVREIENTYVRMNILTNRARHLGQSIGRALVPVFETIIEWAIIALKVIERLIAYVARFFGADFELINFESMVDDLGTGMGAVADNSAAVSDGLAGANKQAKELQKTIGGIDQVFTINDAVPSSSAGSGDSGGIGGISGGVGGYDWLDALAQSANVAFLANIGKDVDNVIAVMKDLGVWVGAIAAGLAAWKLSKGFLDGLKWISSTKDIFGGLGLDKLTFGAGFALFVTDLNEFRLAVKDIMENGITFDNAARMISSFVGMIGDSFILMGNINVGGALKAVQGGIEVINAIKLMSEDGINWDNLSKLTKGLSNFAIGYGLMTKNWKMVGTGMAFKGVVILVEEFKNVVEAIKTGDWSGVDKINLFAGVISAIGGVYVALGGLDKIKDIGKKTKDAVATTKEVGGLGQIGTEVKKFEMPNWASIGKTFGIIAAGVTTLVAAVWLIGKIDTKNLQKGKENIKVIGGAFFSLALPLTILLTQAGIIGTIVSKNIVGWKDLVIGLLAVDVGIVNMLAVVSLAALWDTKFLEKGKKNLVVVGEAFKAIETPLNLLLLKATAIGTMIMLSAGLGALAIAAGIVAIDAAVANMLGMVSLAAVWDVVELEKGKTNIEVASKAFTAIQSPLSNLLDMVDQIGSNMTGFAWITGRSYDFEGALEKLGSVMESLITWVKEYSTWNVPTLEKGGTVIDLAGKAGKVIADTLKPLLDMLESIGKNTNNIFGIGDYNYENALSILQDIMESLIKWLGSYKDWGIGELDAGAKAIDLAGRASKPLMDTLVPLVDILDRIGQNTQRTSNLKNYSYEDALSTLKMIMDTLITWVGEYAKMETQDLATGGGILGTLATPLENINNAFERLLPILDSIGKKTNNFLGIGNYDYKGAMKIVTDSIKSIVQAAEDIGKGTSVSNFDKGTELIDKAKIMSKNLDGFNVMDTKNLATVGKNFYDFSVELRAAFAQLQNVKTTNISTIMKALSSLDLNKFKGMGTNIVKSLELGMTTYTFNLKPATKKIEDGLSVDLTSVGSKISSDIIRGINNSSVNLATFNSKVKSGINTNLGSTGTSMANSVVSGINGSRANLTTFTNRVKSNLGVSTYSIGTSIAQGVQNGINGYYPNLRTFTNRLKAGMRVSFEVRSPSRWARDFIGAMIGKGVELGINDTDVDVNPFKRNIAAVMSDMKVSPNVEMPTLNTKGFYANMDRESMKMTTKVQSRYEIDSDKTARSIDGMKTAVIEVLYDLIDAVDDKELGIDADAIGKVSDQYIKRNIVRNQKF